MERVTQRCSTIFIAIGEKTQVYHSGDEGPPDLRQKLLDSTRSMNSATILIADKGGREEILRALHSPESEANPTLTASLAEQPAAPARRYPKFHLRFTTAARLLLAGCLGYLFWVLISLR